MAEMLNGGKAVNADVKAEWEEVEVEVEVEVAGEAVAEAEGLEVKMEMVKKRVRKPLPDPEELVFVERGFRRSVARAIRDT